MGSEAKPRKLSRAEIMSKNHSQEFAVRLEQSIKRLLLALGWCKVLIAGLDDALDNKFTELTGDELRESANRRILGDSS